MKKRYALISLYNKKNINKVCKILNSFGINFLATKSTSIYLKKIGYPCKEISNYTKFKQILNGRVKTLHPKIHASLLYDRKNKNHLLSFKKLNFPSIDFVIINFYSYNNKKSFEDNIDMIDIGGPTLIRSAAKNFKYVTTICNLNDYQPLIKNIQLNSGYTSIDFRKKMALKAFKTTSDYDLSIFKSENKSNKFLKSSNKKLNLRYGENPHQKSYLIQNKGIDLMKQVIQGKKLSYNNILDIDSAYNCISEFKEPTCAIFKHNNPCGVSSNKNLNVAYNQAKNSDLISSFGGIIVFNKKVDESLAKVISTNFYEIVMAPDFTLKAKNIFKTKKLILLMTKKFNKKKNLDLRLVNQGYLFQSKNSIIVNRKNIKLVSNKKASKKELDDLIFAFKVSKHVKSNAIVLAKNKTTLGIGAGQMSRIDATKLALKKIISNNKQKGYVAASDAFFPFIDNINILYKNNCKAIIQPSGSINDEKIIDFANNKKLPLYFSKYRFFKH